MLYQWDKLVLFINLSDNLTRTLNYIGILLSDGIQCTSQETFINFKLYFEMLCNVEFRGKTNTYFHNLWIKIIDLAYFRTCW